MRTPTPEDPPWEQRLRSIVTDRRLPETLRHDFFLCFEEIDRLRKAIEEARWLVDQVECPPTGEWYDREYAFRMANRPCSKEPSPNPTAESKAQLSFQAPTGWCNPKPMFWRCTCGWISPLEKGPVYFTEALNLHPNPGGPEHSLQGQDSYQKPNS